MADEFIKKHMFFVETDTKLQSAMSFSQYALPVGRSFRLITLIGEQHDEEFKCEKDNPAISVAEYALQTLKNNSRAQILLEIDQADISDSSSWPQSVPILKILEKAKKDSRIIGYDMRNVWLKTSYREILYHHDNIVQLFSKDQVIEFYVKPFSAAKMKTLREVKKQAYDPSAFKFLTETLPANLDSIINRIIETIKKEWSDTHVTSKGLYKKHIGSFIGLGNEFEEEFIKDGKFIDTAFIEVNVISCRGRGSGRVTKFKPQNLQLPDKEKEGRKEGKKKGLVEKRLKILERLKYFWTRVTDWYMLVKMFHRSDVDEIISIMGDFHHKNVSEIFSGIRNLSKQVGKKGECVSLIKTMYIKN